MHERATSCMMGPTDNVTDNIAIKAHNSLNLHLHHNRTRPYVETVCDLHTCIRRQTFIWSDINGSSTAPHWHQSICTDRVNEWAKHEAGRHGNVPQWCQTNQHNLNWHLTQRGVVSVQWNNNNFCQTLLAIQQIYYLTFSFLILSKTAKSIFRKRKNSSRSSISSW